LRSEYGYIENGANEKPTRFELLRFPDADVPIAFYLREAQDNEGAPICELMAYAVAAQLAGRFSSNGKSFKGFFFYHDSKVWHYYKYKVAPEQKRMTFKFVATLTQDEVEKPAKIKLSRSEEDSLVQAGRDLDIVFSRVGDQTRRLHFRIGIFSLLFVAPVWWIYISNNPSLSMAENRRFYFITLSFITLLTFYSLWKSRAEFSKLLRRRPRYDRVSLPKITWLTHTR
jgi:hypothetical protein